MGFGVGMVGTVLGIGGGFFIVPFLMLGFGFTSSMASGTSLAIIFVTGVSGSLTYLIRKRVRLRLGIPLALAIIPGAYLGRYLNPYLDETYFELFFTVFLIMAMIYLWARRPVTGSTEPSTDRRLGMSWWWIIPAILLVGAATTILGIGGGIVLTPLMAFFAGLPVVEAVATSYFILTWNSLAATLSSAHFGHLDWRIVLLMGVGGILGAQVGAPMAPRVRPAFVKNLLIGVLLVLIVSLGADLVHTLVYSQN